MFFFNHMTADRESLEGGLLRVCPPKKMLITNLCTHRDSGPQSEMHKPNPAGYSFSTQLTVITCGSCLLLERIAGSKLHVAKRQFPFLAKIFFFFSTDEFS